MHNALSIVLYRMDIQTFTAVMTINTTKPYLSAFVLIFALSFEPSGAPIRLPITVNTVGQSGISPTAIFPTMPPTADIKTMASEEAMVVRVGTFSTVSMIGIRINAPPAPTIPTRYLPQRRQLPQSIY